MAIGRLLFQSLPRAVKGLLVFVMLTTIAGAVIFAVTLDVRLPEPWHDLVRAGGAPLAGLLAAVVLNRRIRSAESFIGLVMVTVLAVGLSQAYAVFVPHSMPLPEKKLSLCEDGAANSAADPLAGGSCSPE